MKNLNGKLVLDRYVHLWNTSLIIEPNKKQMTKQEKINCELILFKDTLSKHELAFIHGKVFSKLIQVHEKNGEVFFCLVFDKTEVRCGSHFAKLMDFEIVKRFTRPLK